MSKFEAEKLREALMDLERSRQKEEFERKMAECLVTGLRLISSTSDREEMFCSVFDHINTLIPFDSCFLLQETQGKMDEEIELLPVYPIMNGTIKFESKLAQYKSQSPLYVFNVKDWETYLFKQITQNDLQNASLLILPLKMDYSKYWFFMISSFKSGFTRQHITVASKVSELLKQAIVKDVYIVKLIQSNKLRALGEMAGGIAHEINNPLAIIQGSLEILTRLLSPDELSRTALIMKNMEKTVDRMSKIIQGLRVISRGEDTQNSKSSITLEEVLDDTLSCCYEKFRSSGVELLIEIDTKLKNKKRHLNRVLLSQVFLNILNNAFDAIKMHEKKWIKIKIEKKEQALHLYFIDSGAGIPKNIQNKIFQPFFTTKEVGEGIGLGLGICKSIIEELKGTIFIDTNFSNTCVHIVLPTD